ncbi:MAG: hypothetical protein QOG72_3070 [Sphingomonadales bacterium]|jgi:hypothetical protein|nr:hypothetical protein [Sphingomonadales bacterium]
MQSTIVDAVLVLIACLAITVVIVGFVLLRPAKRRQRRRRRHSTRHRIDLLKPAQARTASEPDA